MSRPRLLIREGGLDAATMLGRYVSGRDFEVQDPAKAPRQDSIAAA